MANQKVTAKEWITKGIELFSTGGIEALNVEKTAKMLKCTKGSFYHHFNSREKYLDQILDHWYNSRKGLLTGLNDLSLSPQLKLKSLIKSFFNNPRGLDFEFYLRRSAKNHPKSQRLLSQIEKDRLTYVAVLLEEAGVKFPDRRAEMLYNYYLGWYERNRAPETEPGITNTELEELSLLLGIDLAI